MQKPNFSVIIGVAFLIIGSFIPPISTDELIQSYVIEDTFSYFGISALVLSALILIASAYRRSKLEISIICTVALVLPFIAKLYAERQIEQWSRKPFHPDVPAHVFNWSDGTYLIWIGAVIVLASTILAKNNEVT